MPRRTRSDEPSSSGWKVVLLTGMLVLTGLCGSAWLLADGDSSIRLSEEGGSTSSPTSEPSPVLGPQIDPNGLA